MSTGLDVIVAHDGLMRSLRFFSFCFKHQVCRVKTNNIRTFKISRIGSLSSVRAIFFYQSLTFIICETLIS